MSLKYIREHYGVPARRGQKVKYTGEYRGEWFGTITSSSGPHIKVKPDDRTKSSKFRLILHPTWNVEYL